ncbi:glycine betaine ABC transporter substrate-binding protein [Euzebya sp.]|uniref:glycine betaine ABC transporter substrate-binding protein n=1 Tax=Euzebya sp. TaxID=1971409 RepID=UPI0035174022
MKLRASALLLVLALAAAGCFGGNSTSSGGEGPLEGAEITIGSKDFDEQLVLGHMSRILLEENGAAVTDRINLGGTDATRSALTSGEIDHYWEYTGTAWISFYEEDDPIDDRQEQFDAVAERDLEENDLVWVAPSQFNNTYALAYASDAGDELGNPESLADLGPIIEETPELATLCVETEFPARNDGLPGMEAAYGYEFPEDNVTVLDTGVVYESTAAQDPCYFGEVFTTDGRIAELDLVVLEDPEQFFPLYNASPVFRSEVYDEYGDAIDEIFTPVAEALDNDTMASLNARVSGEEAADPADVAREYLEEEGFISADE